MNSGLFRPSTLSRRAACRPHTPEAGYDRFQVEAVSQKRPFLPLTPLTRTSQAWCCPWLPAAWQKKQRLTQCSPYSTLLPGCSKVDSHFPLPQDFQEHYVQTGPGQLFVGSTQRFLHDGLPASLRCNHSIQYDEARGPQPQLVQHLRASSISSAFDPEAEALRFQLTTALQAGEAPVSYLHLTS